MPNVTWTSTSPCLLALAALLVAGCGGRPAPPNFRILRQPPIMTETVEAEATARSLVAECADGQEGCVPTRDDGADFMWACDAYGAYIDDLRDP